MGAPPAQDWICVAVAFSSARGEADEIEIRLRLGATVLDALHESGVLQRAGAGALDSQAIGVWGRACAADTLLADGDRVELYRPLAMDPKEARRLRASRRPERPR